MKAKRTSVVETRTEERLCKKGKKYSAFSLHQSVQGVLLREGQGALHRLHQCVLLEESGRGAGLRGVQGVLVLWWSVREKSSV